MRQNLIARVLMALLFAMSVAACNGGSTDKGGDKDGEKAPVEKADKDDKDDKADEAPEESDEDLEAKFDTEAEKEINEDNAKAKFDELAKEIEADLASE